MPDIHLPGAIVPFIPYPRPVEIPTAAPGDAPTVCLQVNVEWLPYLLGCAKALIVDSTWASSDQSIVNSATSRANDLLDILASDGSCSSVEYRLDPNNACIIQARADSTSPWLTFYDPITCSPTAVITHPASGGRNLITTQPGVAALQTLAANGDVGASINEFGESTIKVANGLPTPDATHWGSTIGLTGQGDDQYFICRKMASGNFAWIAIAPPYVPPAPPDLSKYLVKQPNIDGDNGLHIEGNHFGLSIDNYGSQAAIGINQVSDQYAINAVAAAPGGTQPPLQLGVAADHNSAFLRLVGGYGTFDAITTAFAYRAPTTTLPPADASQYGAIMLSGGAPVICLLNSTTGAYSWQPLGGSGTPAATLEQTAANKLSSDSQPTATLSTLPDGNLRIVFGIPAGDSGLLLPVINNPIDSTQTQSVLYNATAKQLTANLFKPLPVQVAPTPPAGQNASCLLAANIAEDFKEAALAAANTATTTGSLFSIAASLIGLLLLSAVEVGSAGTATPFVAAIAGAILTTGGSGVAATVTDASVHALQQDIFCAIGNTHLVDQPAIDAAKAAIYADSAIPAVLQTIFANMLDAKGVRGLNELGATQFVKSATCEDCPISGYQWQVHVNLAASSYHFTQQNGGTFIPGKGIASDIGTWLLRFHVPFTAPSGSCTIKYASMHVASAESQNGGSAYLYKGQEFVMLQDFTNPFTTGDSVYTRSDLSIPITHSDYIDCDVSATQQPDGQQQVWYVSFTLAGDGLPPTFNP